MMPLALDSRWRDADEARRAVMALARHASIETSTRNLAEIESYPRLIPAGTDVFIPWISGMPYHHAVDVARRLRDVGMNPVPHVAARRLVSAGQLEDFLGSLVRDASVETVLLVAGDAEHPAGPFDSSAEVLESGVFQRVGIGRFGVAGYPEGHPKIAEAELKQALARKIDFARKTGLELFVVTQFCLEAQPIIAWERRLREGGFEVPVRIGLAGVASVGTLLRFGWRCGIGNSLRALSRAPVSLTRLIAQYGPDEVLPGLALGMRDGAASKIAGLHLFPFGGFAATADWLRRVACGDFALPDA